MNIGLVEHFLLMPWFNSSTFEKLYFLKMGPIFADSYATQNKPIKKTICWHQLFRQKWAFSRLSTSVLHKCGHARVCTPSKLYHYDKNCDIQGKVWLYWSKIWKGMDTIINLWEKLLFWSKLNSGIENWRDHVIWMIQNQR